MPYFIKNKRHTCSVQVSSNNLGYNILFFYCTSFYSEVLKWVYGYVFVVKMF